MERVKVVIVDDEHLVRSGLRLVLDGADGISVVGEASGGEEAVSVVKALTPDVVLMDIRMPQGNGIEATRALAALPCKVVMLTAFDTDEFLLDALAAGACGFLLKDTAPRELVTAVHQAADGELQFSPTVLARLVSLAGRGRATTAEGSAGFADLTDREREVAIAVAEGLSNAEIAAALFLGLPTIKTHLGRVFAKLGVSSRLQVALAVRAALPELANLDQPSQQL